MQMGQAPQMTGFKGEQLFTGAILQLSEGRKPKVLFTTGHGERSLDDQRHPWPGGHPGDPRARQLRAGGVGPARQAGRPGRHRPAGDRRPDRRVPAAGARRLRRLPEQRRTHAGDARPHPRADRGRGADRPPASSPGWPAAASRWATTSSSTRPTPCRSSAPQTSSSRSQYGDHPITKPLAQVDVPVLLNLARSVAAGEAGEGLQVAELLKTSGRGLGRDQPRAARDGGARRRRRGRSGPHGRGRRARRRRQARCAWSSIGDSDFATNQLVQAQPGQRRAARELPQLAGRARGAARPSRPRRRSRCGST